MADCKCHAHKKSLINEESQRRNRPMLNAMPETTVVHTKP